MSSSGNLYFDDYPVGYTQNHVDEWIFIESDKKIIERKVSERNKLVWGNLSDDNEIEKAYLFETSVEVIIKRLEIRGYSLISLKNDFEYSQSKLLEELKPHIKEKDVAGLNSFYEMEIDIYEKYNKLEQWIEAFKYIINTKTAIQFYWDVNENILHEDPLINFILKNGKDQYDNCNYGFGFPCSDFDFLARALLESCDKNALVQQDVTELVLGGWYDGFDKLEYQIKPNTRLYEIFNQSINEINQLIDQKKESQFDHLLIKLLYANVITALETYLSDSLIRAVMKFEPLIRRVIERDPHFGEEKIYLKDLFKKQDEIKKYVTSYLENILYHNLEKIKILYQSVLEVDFPQEYTHIANAIILRHDIVHRNGKDKHGNENSISRDDLNDLIIQTQTFVSFIDKQIIEIYNTARLEN